MSNVRWIPALVALVLAACQTEDPPLCSEASKIPAFSDADLDGFGDPSTRVRVCEVALGERVTVAGDCDDTNAEISPTGFETCDGLDNDCADGADDGLPLTTFFVDADEDGFGDPSVSVEACNQPEGTVFDASDCDDTTAAANPIAEEVCDGMDNDCDLLADDDDIKLVRETAPRWYQDRDLDGYGDPDAFQPACLNPNPGKLVDNADDCDDTDIELNPAAVEICDGIDNDCDLLYDDSDPDLDTATQFSWWYDGDEDGAGDPLVTMRACEQPYFWTNNDDDCDDSEPLLAGPGFWTPDNDGDGYGIATMAVGPTCDAGPGYALQAKGVDCDDTLASRNPGNIEICDDIDNDCDNRADDLDVSLDLTTAGNWYEDVDKDGFGTGVATVRCDPLPGQVGPDGDCRDNTAAINPGATEICDAVDNDCDLLLDEADPNLDPASLDTWYPDIDSDGFGDESLAIQACGAPSVLYTDIGGDCDDADALLGEETRWVTDTDGDGFGGGPFVGGMSCVQTGPNTVPTDYGIDCNEADIAINPDAEDVCGDGIDQDCSGADRECPPVSCAELLADAPGTPSGTYELEPIVGTPVQVYCDMVTDGGGWTLVGSSGTGNPLSDVAIGYHNALQDLTPLAAHAGVWDGLRSHVSAMQDLRFTCKKDVTDAAMDVDLSFYDVDWYLDVTADVTDAGTCFLDTPQVVFPARRNNLVGVTKLGSDAYNSGALQGENTCGDVGDFSVDFDDRGLDSNESDGTDWGLDDGAPKCGAKGDGEAWFLFVR